MAKMYIKYSSEQKTVRFWGADVGSVTIPLKQFDRWIQIGKQKQKELIKKLVANL